MSELPEGWANARLRDLTEPTAGWNPRLATSKTFRYVDIEAVDNAAQRIGTVREIPVAEAPSRARVQIKTGDVIFSLVRPYLKNIARVPEDLDGQVASTAFVTLRPPPGIASRFLYYQLVQDTLIKSIPTYGNSPPAARDEEFLDLAVPVAPSQEQDRISAKVEELLSDLDAGVAALERARANLKRYRATVLKAAVEGRLTEKWRAAHSGAEPAEKLLERILVERRKNWEKAQLKKYAEKGQSPPKGWKELYPEPAKPNVTSLPSLPKGWCWTTVESVGDVLLGRQRAPQFLTGRFPRKYLRVANIKDDRIEFDDVEEMDFDETHFAKYRLLPGDILVSEGQSPELVGQSAIFRGELEDLCFQKTLHRYRALTNGVTAEYAQLVFRAHVLTGVFMRLASITTNIAHLTLEKFCAAPFPLAPADEQIEIVRLADQSLSSIEHVRKQTEVERVRSNRLRQSILKRAFEGKLVPQDPKDEPASELLARIRAGRAAAVKTDSGIRKKIRQKASKSVKTTRSNK